MLFLLSLSTAIEYSNQQRDKIKYDFYYDIDLENHRYIIQNCQFINTGSYDESSSIDFRNGDGDKYIEVRSCIIIKGRGNYGGGLYFDGNFNFNIDRICISACSCYHYSAIAYLNGGENNNYNISYLTSNQCLPAKHQLYMKNFKEYTNSNVSFTKAIGYTYGVVCVESVHNDKRYSFNTFTNNTSYSSIVYFYQMSYNTTATDCICVGNEATYYSLIIYDQESYVKDVYLRLVNFYIFGNNVHDYYTYHEYDHGRIIVENCSADLHSYYYYVIFVGNNTKLEENEPPIMDHFSTHHCEIYHNVDDVNVTPVEDTPFETAFETPYVTAQSTPFETAVETPYLTPIQTMYETAIETPFETFGMTPLDDADENNDTVSSESQSNSAYGHVLLNKSNDQSRSDIDGSSSSLPNDDLDLNSPNKKLSSEHWIIIGVVLFTALVTIAAVSIYLYMRKSSQMDESEVEMAEETVITTRENIAVTLENPLFTTTINETDDPFKSAFEDSGEEGVFYINEN